MDGVTPERLFIVGDIHGCLAELEALLAGLPLQPGDGLVFLGDYVDRGPDSRGVIERLLALAASSTIPTVFLRGNHEDMLLAFLGRGGHYGEAFLANGGDATARSYGLRGGVTPDRLHAALPREHLRFLEETRLVHTAGDYVMVHAGIVPGRPLEQQSAHDLVWIRDEFIARPHGLGRTVVFGHTPCREVLVHLPYKIGIDTGCVYGGMLTALEVPSRTVHAVRRGAATVEHRALAA
jgi:serine/threonine protein phosphatase 1